MWSIDKILAPTSNSLTPPPSPGCLPVTTPTRRGYGSMRFRPYERRTLWSLSTENCNPNTNLCFSTPPTPPSTFLSPLNPRPLRELALNSTMPPQSAGPSPVVYLPRFASPLSGKELDQLCTPFVPRQTQNNNSWATGVFKTWLSTRNSTLLGADIIPSDILEVGHPLPVIDRALAAFILEARRADGNF